MGSASFDMDSVLKVEGYLGKKNYLLKCAKINNPQIKKYEI